MSDLKSKLQKLGLSLPAPPKPAGAYLPLRKSGEFLFLSGQLSKDEQGKVRTGKVGKELTVEEGKRAARQALVQALSLLDSHVGLEKVDQVLRLVGYVQSADNFYGQSEVLNGASELLVEILGEKGRHARTAIGVANLPLNAAVELELTVRIQ